MKITLESLEEKESCRDGKAWFNSAFPDGGEYQSVIDQAVKDDRLDYVRWLLDNFGATYDVLEIDGDLISSVPVFFVGHIRVKGRISVDGYLFAGEGIEAGEGIKAGWGIEAGEGIKAGWGIKAGDDWGIYAGLRVRINKTAYRTVIASTEPRNLMCGVYKERAKPRSEQAARLTRCPIK